MKLCEMLLEMTGENTKKIKELKLQIAQILWDRTHDKWFVYMIISMYEDERDCTAVLNFLKSTHEARKTYLYLGLMQLNKDEELHPNYGPRPKSEGK